MTDFDAAGTDGHRCLNCGRIRAGRWCSACGQDGERRLKGAAELVLDVGRSLLDLDGRVVRTLTTLVREPGRLVRDYAQGRFVAQLSPVRLYLAMSALYFFLAPVAGDGLFRLSGGAESGPWFSFGPLTWDSELLLFLLVPLWAVAIRPLLGGGDRRLEEVFVFSVHYQVFFLGVVALLGLVAAGFARLGLPHLVPGLLVGGLIVPLGYLRRSLRTAFEIEGVRLGVLTVVLFLLHLGGGQLLQRVG